MKQDLVLRDYFLSTRREILQWMAGAAGAVMVGCATGKTNGDATGGGSSTNWTDLQGKLQSKFVAKADASYEADRMKMAWNALKPDRHPDGIVHAASEEDVKEAMRFATANKVKVAVRGGGHHFNSPAIRNSGILLDVSGLKEINVDPATKTAMVGPGVYSKELITALNPHGLAFPVGHCSNVPMSGFLLNGGFGWNSGGWGPAALNIKGVDVVTASGESMYADGEKNPELYWAARGAGIGFPGVVTRYHLNVHPLPKVIKTSTLMFKIDDMEAAAGWLATAQAGIPPPVELSALVVSPPPEAQEKGAPPRIFLVLATAFADTEADAKKWLAPFENGPKSPAPINKIPFVDTPFDALFASIDGAFPENHRYAADHVWTNASIKDLVTSVKDKVVTPPFPRDFVMMAFGPNLPKEAPPLPNMALSSLGRIYVGIYGVWTDPAQDVDNKNWVKAVNAAMDTHKVGRYIGDADIDAGEDHSKQCFSQPAWDQLSAVKKKYDPEDIFFSFNV